MSASEALEPPEEDRDVPRSHGDTFLSLLDRPAAFFDEPFDESRDSIRQGSLDRPVRDISAVAVGPRDWQCDDCRLSDGLRKRAGVSAT